MRAGCVGGGVFGFHATSLPVNPPSHPTPTNTQHHPLNTHTPQKTTPIQYAKDEEAFFRDFAAAFGKLLALGVPAAGAK